jgi:dephospho-CoA kinase
MGRAWGLVGAIASGKSTAARWFAERGWQVVDADREAHALYAPGSELVAALADRFGGSILTPEGGVDRPALGRIVFGDPVALRDLDALVHPAARAHIAASLESARSRGDVVLEMALLHRWPEMVAGLDRVVGISCPEEIRLDRLMSRSGLSRHEASRRLASQEASLLLSPATVVLENAGTVEELEKGLSAFVPG